MINPLELRIGSIFYAKDWDYMEATEITKEYINVADKDLLIVKWEDAQGIPITLPLLGSIGFVLKAKGVVCFDLDNYERLSFDNRENFLRHESIGTGFTRRLLHIKYLHQLQNWILAHGNTNFKIYITDVEKGDYDYRNRFL